ncbi:MAG: FHA domain-containing protein [Armatimonadota bacterium]|nr:FHA domain-containing protein [Armatimonadota bacterium]
MSLKSKIILNSLLGAIGGLIAWAVTKAILPGFFAVQEHSPNELLLGNSVFGVLSGVAIGGMLGAADGLWSRSPAIFRRAILIGSIAGAIAGFMGLAVGQTAFSLLVPEGENRTLGSFMLMVIGHAVGWTFIGGALGAAQGAIGMSSIRARHGAIGGLIGGFIGGMSFDVSANILRSDSLSRMIGLTITGYTIGFMVGLLQDLLKQAWVVVLQGNNEGREIPLYKPISTIGRDELADVPIFTDLTVGPRHAFIKVENNRHVLEDAGSALGTSIDGQKVTKQLLKDGDIIEIGAVRLLFREKATAAKYVISRDMPKSSGQANIPNLAHVCQFCGGIKDAQGNCQCSVGTAPAASQSSQQAAVPTSTPPIAPVPVPQAARLVALAGPYSSHIYDLQAVETTIGREDGRDICLAGDKSVSRRHARVAREESGFFVYDEGSSNGTFVNGARVTRAALSPGDKVSVGTTELRFEF